MNIPHLNPLITMTDALYDIKENMKQWKDDVHYPTIEKLMDDFKSYDYSHFYVNTPAAFGDTYKTTVEYTIGDYQFKYIHICGDEMVSAMFEMKLDAGEGENESDEGDNSDGFETLWMWSQLTDMMKRSGMMEDKSVLDETENFQNFCNQYALENAEDEEKHKNKLVIITTFTILNAFVTGHGISIHHNAETGDFFTAHTPLDAYIDVKVYFPPSANSSEYDEDEDEDEDED